MKHTNAPLCHTHTPLWDNQCLPELLLLPDYKIWVALGVIYLSNVLVSGRVKSFPELKTGFGISNYMSS